MRHHIGSSTSQRHPPNRELFSSIAIQSNLHLNTTPSTQFPPPPNPQQLTLFRAPANMHLMYTLDAAGKRIYTLKKVVGAEVTKSAHPARFSPDDKYSRHRVTLKKRYGLLLTQQKSRVVLGQ
ncbi:hypothetical protein HYALB_00004845 [Hymenoscyphus albidus]|uniref:H/ACA ribonucleoprotein complex subunit NOP10 n=1 Tax=Hymenoscyphus albidus TaxID=595503 RepID=A0A9N9LVL1_9HELO|nr:hypothetical protein HYALB_00004845 [Hymenoscyphus albidus]